ncbi:MAG: carbamoyl-phosphate synthase large subunit, partial [Clostridiales bacterium]|nr:carbamoyl-phosphate synthase large subunit [Clostridiales bacterium]
MSIGRTYKEAFQKAIRSLETGRYGLGYAAHFNEIGLYELLHLLSEATSQRQFIMYEALRKGATVEQLNAITKIKTYFIEQMKELVEMEEQIASEGKNITDETLTNAKKDGFSDRYLSKLTGYTEDEIRTKRRALGVVEGFEGIHVSGTENSAYYYSTYNAPDSIKVSKNCNKVMILGGGPNRIGQGIEFDYCCVHASFALKDLGFETIIVNCNPETVSTDYDTSDKLYFEPLTLEDVLSIYEKEKPLGVITQFGGQTPLNLASALEAHGVNILGTSPATIDMAEDRDLFRAMMERLDIPMPQSGMAHTVENALEIAQEIGYPLMVRPSYVLGGRGMEVVYDNVQMTKYMLDAIDVSPERPILIDRFLQSAMETEADAISDGENVFVPSVMEHIELAGVHSGDSACVLPPFHMEERHKKIIEEYTARIAREMGVRGLMNVQYAIADDKVYVLEANPRASRTVPLVSKVCNINMVRLATEIMIIPYTGGKSPIEGLEHKHIPHYGVKEAVFPFNMFPEVDPVLGPEMRSTGEVLGMSSSFGEAFFKAEEATQTSIPTSGTVLISVNDNDKELIVPIARSFKELGFNIVATGGTHAALTEAGIEAEKIFKLGEGIPSALDKIASGEVTILINTPLGKRSVDDDSYIRKAAIKSRIYYITTIAAASATAEGISDAVKLKPSVKSLQEYHSEIK